MTSTEMDATASCPGDETLAAFVDDRLDAGARQAVVSHLADCADCRDIVWISSEATASQAKVVRGNFGRRPWATLVAAAAAVLVLLGIPSVRERILPGDPMAGVAEVAREAPLRASEARLSVDVTYKPETQVDRGDAENGSLSTEQALADAQARAERTPTAEALHALGVANLLNGNEREAVAALQSSAAKTPSAAVYNDLSAAYYVIGDYRRAIDAADRAWTIEQTPSSLWNRAFALKALGRDAEAIAAWNQFGKIEKDPAWQDAARKAIEALKAP